VKWLEDAAVRHGSSTTPQLRAMLCTLHDWVEPNGKHESTIIATAKHIKPLLMPIPTAEQNSRGIFLCMLQAPVPGSIILSTEPPNPVPFVGYATHALMQNYMHPFLYTAHK